ncbi:MULTISPECIES: PLP-dependent aminotransferase family protein [unclassified Acinetobacter]|uniref:aminotransferase-like domain-containing protein n=1 Tax=unclassified Acinetobacter TaxID=196816 RepID=UPI000445B314|nr:MULTISPECIES: PLP-dependent aminotransferase family protein [unclassified Acinetobacter]EZQ12007.1 GntR family transcriptional regulator [Acinetobacter sp. Ver3]
MFQYQILAKHIKQKILSGELCSGQKLISLRQFSALHAVSLNTAKNCYTLLESEGLITVKNKSGYFVQHLKSRNDSPVLPYHHEFEAEAKDISNLDLQIEIQESSINNRSIHLGAVQISPNHVPVDAIRKSIQRALKHSQPEDFLYSNRQGHLRLRQALSDHWAEDGFYINPDETYITNGCMAALSLVVQLLTKEGDGIVIPTPNFNGQLQLLGTLKRKLIEIPANVDGFDLERLERAMQHPDTKACLLTVNYQNPLGFELSNHDKQKIVQLAEQYQCYVIEDDIYAECSFNLQRPLPIKHWDEAGYVILCSSISKSLSSAYRVGWFCLPPRLKYLHRQIVIQNVSVNTPLQLALADLMYSRAYREHLLRLKPKLNHQVDAYRKTILNAFHGIDIGLSQPDGGYVLWLQLPTHIDGLELYYAARQHGINIVPGDVFGEERRYKNYIRLNAGHELTHEIHDSIVFLADWVKQKMRSSSQAPS